MRGDQGNRRNRALIGAVAALLASSASGTASAQGATASAAPSNNAMENLVRLLVKQGTITQSNGDALIAQAKADAQQAAPAAGGLPDAAPGTIRVPYVPASVRKQISDQVREDMMAQAKTQGWATPGQAAPDWVRKIKITGDFRLRDESDLFSQDNSNEIINFAAINAAGPYNLGGGTFVLPFLNTRRDRTNQLKLRARLGVDANISPLLQAGFRLATGDDNGPISTNTNLASGFGKRNIWLDRAYLNITPTSYASATVGRMPNPFRSTDLLFDTDLNFDGVVAHLDAKKWLGEKAHVRATIGAFPLDFGSANNPSTQQAKRGNREKWLYSAQIEAGTKVGGVEVSASAAYHDFSQVQGKLSAPCAVDAGIQDCTTDASRPFFLNKGNTLFPLRNIVTTVPPQDGLPAANPQFLGLAFKYRVLDLNATVTIPVSEQIRVGIDGNYIRNLGFKRRDICRYAPLGEPVNNVTTVNGSSDPCGGQGKFNGGNQGYMARASVGTSTVNKWGDWSFTGGYRYLESDATLDSFTDSDFHLGGTNSKGYFVAASVGLFNGLSLTGRWLSANEISGPPLSIDVLQVDLSAQF